MTTLAYVPALRTLRRAVLGRPLVAGGAVLLGVLSGAVSLASPLLVRALVVDFAEHRSPVLGALQLAATVLLGAIAAGVSSFLLASVGERGVAAVRDAVVTHLLRLPPAAIRRLGVGDMVARVTADAAALRSLTDVGVTALPVSALVVLVSLVLMGTLDWVLLIVVIATFAVAAVAMRAFLRRMRSGNAAQQEALGALAERLAAALSTLTVIKAYRAEQHVRAPIMAHSDAAADAAISGARAQAFLTPLMGVAQQIAIIGVLAGSGARLSSGQLSAADFVAFMMYLFQIVSPLTMVASGFGRLQQGLAAVGRLDALGAQQPEDPGAERNPDVVPGAPALELRSVSAGYDQGDVLHGVSFTVAPRGLTAVVGGSGAGKSTVLNVLERFVDVRSGAALLHGRPLAHWPTAALRARIAYVDQSFTLLAGSVRENLTLGGDPSTPDDVLLRALAEVGMEAAVRALPDGLDTVIGAATDLSGGQRQRLALARALLSAADVVLLDEPSSQLDGLNEQRLVEVVDRLIADRAVVMVAHRLSTVRHADQVVFLDQGRVAGVGTHDELRRHCAGYRDLVGFQTVENVDLAKAVAA
ncbi:ABC transporter ATP-binding protein [Micromonospora sp. DT228]|uniref:ABC transporter ATP-binding protein n=1 Tax=Micromonospora sp. DT228 TaxID=3393443 RepID=UPI003CFA2B15